MLIQTAARLNRVRSIKNSTICILRNKITINNNNNNDSHNEDCVGNSDDGGYDL